MVKSNERIVAKIGLCGKIIFLEITYFYVAYIGLGKSWKGTGVPVGWFSRGRMQSNIKRLDM